MLVTLWNVNSIMVQILTAWSDANNLGVDFFIREDDNTTRVSIYGVTFVDYNHKSDDLSIAINSHIITINKRFFDDFDISA